jgi:glucans biosynthesis protein C
MKSKLTTRIIYLDSLRLFLLIVVIFYHSAMMYSLPLSFYYHELATDFFSRGLLSLFMSIDMSFFMGLFFFISGYFTPDSVKKRGSKNFLIVKFKRYFPLLIIYIFIINPFIVYFASKFGSNIGIYYLTIYKSILSLPNELNPGHLWYIQTLLVFYLGFVVWKRLRLNFSFTFPGSQTGFIKITAYTIIIIAVITFLVRLGYPIGSRILYFMIPYLPQNLAMFIAGILERNLAWSGYTAKLTKWIAVISVIGIIIWPIMLLPANNSASYIMKLRGGFNWESFMYICWEILIGTSISLLLINLFKKITIILEKISLKFSGDYFAIFVFHVFPVTLMGILLKNLPLPQLIKFVLVAFSSTLATFLISHYLRISYLSIQNAFARSIKSEKIA